MDAAKLQSYVEAVGAIPSEEIEEAFQTDDLLKLGILREIITSHWNRLDPALNVAKCSRVVVRYLLSCLEQNPEPSDYLLSRYESAHELLRLVRHWENGTQEFQCLMRETIESIRELYVRTDDKTRLCIETGFLEHLLENRLSLRWLNRWESDPITATAITDSLKWGQRLGKGPMSGFGNE